MKYLLIFVILFSCKPKSDLPANGYGVETEYIMNTQVETRIKEMYLTRDKIISELVASPFDPAKLMITDDDLKTFRNLFIQYSGRKIEMSKYTSLVDEIIKSNKLATSDEERQENREKAFNAHAMAKVSMDSIKSLSYRLIECFKKFNDKGSIPLFSVHYTIHAIYLDKNLDHQTTTDTISSFFDRNYELIGIME